MNLKSNSALRCHRNVTTVEANSDDETRTHSRDQIQARPAHTGVCLGAASRQGGRCRGDAGTAEPGHVRTLSPQDRALLWVWVLQTPSVPGGRSPTICKGHTESQHYLAPVPGICRPPEPRELL